MFNLHCFKWADRKDTRDNEVFIKFEGLGTFWKSSFEMQEERDWLMN